MADSAQGQPERESPPGGAAPGRSAGLGFDRFTVGIAIGAVTLVGILLVVALAQPERSVPMDESQPAGVVHNYYLALLNDEPSVAYEYLSAEAKVKLPYTRFAAQRSRGRDGAQLRIEDEKIEGETARVTVRRIFPSGGFFPFTSNEYSSQQTIVLRREDGAWKLADAPY